MNGQFLLIPFALLMAAGAAHADPADLLRAAEGADRRLSYTGIRTVRATAGPKETERRVKVSHRAPDQTRIEYLSPGEGHVLLELGSGRWLYSPRRSRWWPIEWRPTPSRLDLLLRNYRVRYRGKDRVAGRRVVQLSIEPRHPGNPNKKVWIDPKIKMVLQEEVRDSEGRLIAASAFERFEITRDLSADLFQPPPAPLVRPMPPPPPFSPLRPRYLPPGYELVRTHGLERGRSEGVCLRYTDGLGTISLFQFRGKNGMSRSRGEGRSRRKGSERWDSHRKRLTRQVGDLECRVMGDAAPDELKKVLDSLAVRL
jgi:outer membrane lipoprotein-sorting protein